MAKITTKKPGKGGEGPIDEVSQDVVSLPEIMAKALVETTAVPVKSPPTQPKAPQAQAADKDVPKVQVTKLPQQKSTNFTPRPPVTLTPEAKPKSKRFIVAFGGVLLILVSLSKLSPGGKNYDPELLPLDQTSREMLMSDDPVKMAHATWKNEEPGFFGSFFHKLCLGYAKSYGCSSEPLHPFKRVAEQLGVPLNFEKEEDKKVIEQTIEYKSRAFTFGK